MEGQETLNTNARRAACNMTPFNMQMSWGEEAGGAEAGREGGEGGVVSDIQSPWVEQGRLL